MDVTDAAALHAEISRLARAHDHRALYRLADADHTHRLLDELGESQRTRSLVHLESARRWAGRQIELANRRLDEAEAALSTLDVRYAKALLVRMDDEFVVGEARRRRDELFVAVAGREHELEQLGRTAEAIAEEAMPRRRWWQRRRPS